MVTLIHIFNYPESSDSSVSKCGRRNRFSPDGRCSCLSLNLRYIIDTGAAASMLYISTAVAEWFKAVDLSSSKQSLLERSARVRTSSAVLFFFILRVTSPLPSMFLPLFCYSFFSRTRSRLNIHRANPSQSSSFRLCLSFNFWPRHKCKPTRQIHVGCILMYNRILQKVDRPGVSQPTQ